MIVSAPPLLNIGQLVTAVFAAARMANPALNARWVAMSIRLGGRLPQSLLMVSVQRAGEVDLVCRALERDLVDQPASTTEIDLRHNYLSMLAEWWISSAYAVCYTLSSRKLLVEQEFLGLANDLRMVRVQLEKHELPSDRQLKEPMRLAPTKLRPDETEAPIYIYDKDDPRKSHIPGIGISSRHSMMWEVIDVKTGTQRWLERTELSERMLRLLAPA